MVTQPSRAHSPLGRKNGGDGNGHDHSGNGNGNGNGYTNGNGHVTAMEQLYEILHVLFKRWRWVVGLFVLVSLPGLAATCARSPIYSAQGKVLIVSDRANATIQPTEVDSLATLKLNAAIVNSEVQLIRSRDLMERVVRGLVVARNGGGVLAIANAANGEGAIGKSVVDSAKRLKVTPIRNSNVIEIEYSSTEPAKAAQMVNRVIDEYLDYHADVHGHRGLVGFYEEQGRLLTQDLRRAEQALRDFAKREGLVAPIVELQQQVGALSELEKEIRERDAAIAGTEEKLRTIRAQIAEQPTEIRRSQQLEISPEVRQLASQIINREIDRVALLRKYTEKDRHVRDNAEEIDELTTQLQEARQTNPKVVTSEVFATNPVYETQLYKMLELEARLKEHRARRIAVEEHLERGRRHLVRLKDKALEFDQLDQEVKRQRASLDLFMQREQEARIGDAMDQKRLVNVEVVERPGKPFRRADQKKTPMMLAIITGLVVGLAGAFGAEYLSGTLRFEREVEHRLGLPVLGSIRDTTA
jgi:uncharacterized protein involved in exopolysaccharide biosynthesis